MDQLDTPSLLSTTVLLEYTLTDLLIAFSILLIIVLPLKAFFRGGQFTIPTERLQRKKAVVTGGNSGIGAETVKVLCELGCSVVIGARNKETAESVIKSIRKNNPRAQVQYFPLDLSSRASIQAFANAVKFAKIDYLINNAGIMSIPQRKTTKEGVEMQWGVNHLGHFYLTYLLWKKLTSSAFFRIINVSSLAHKKLFGFGPQPKIDWQNINFEKDYNPDVSYSRSKLYNVLFTKALAEKVGRNGLVAALHPGVVRTQLLRQITGDGVKGQIFKIILIIVYPLWWLISKNSYEGCQTTLFATLSDKVENGGYYSDCKPSGMNSNVTAENWNRLWQISQRKLAIKFEI